MQIYRLEDKCSNCMLCVRECVSGIWRNVNGVPTPVEIDLCNRCSHCIAVCPKNAIVHEGLDAKQALPVKSLKIDPEAYRGIVLSRRSVRQYKDRAVPRELIGRILDLARYSPTASNDQNVGFITVTDRALIGEIAGGIFGFADRLAARLETGPGRLFMKVTGLAKNRYIRRMDYAREMVAGGRDIILHNAPVMILVHGPAKGSFVCDNCSIAATNIINYAHALGLGTCYIGFMTLALRFSKKLGKKLKVPEGRKVYASLVMGYPAYSHPNTVSRKKADILWIEKSVNS
ncbi:MAG: nitroreductase family protein [Spirochaetes bacterium]|nr:nitroreductase family protein [Spirochaetota bacterium]